MEFKFGAGSNTAQDTEDDGTRKRIELDGLWGFYGSRRIAHHHERW
jgi:hypothetical protein